LGQLHEDKTLIEEDKLNGRYQLWRQRHGEIGRTLIETSNDAQWVREIQKSLPPVDILTTFFFVDSEPIELMNGLRLSGQLCAWTCYPAHMLSVR
jgi:hypothetical protein